MVYVGMCQTYRVQSFQIKFGSIYIWYFIRTWIYSAIHKYVGVRCLNKNTASSNLPEATKCCNSYPFIFHVYFYGFIYFLTYSVKKLFSVIKFGMKKRSYSSHHIRFYAWRPFYFRQPKSFCFYFFIGFTTFSYY